MKDLYISYFLAAAGLFTPLAGLHRFYLDKPVSAFFYVFTWGFFGIGTIVDLIRMPTLVNMANGELALLEGSSRPRLSSPERAILRCAQANDGLVTVQTVALSSGLSMADAKLELDRLFREDFCSKDVDEDGVEIYHFKGLKPKAKI